MPRHPPIRPHQRESNSRKTTTRETHLKILFFYICKAIGLFHLSRFLMRRRLLILCFHGIALADEHAFRPMLFMRESVFRNRLETIRKNGFPVVSLSEGLSRLSAGQLPPNPITITIDDGFYNALSRAAPILQSYSLPATLYLTTYYVEKGTPIFRLVVQYMFWKTTVEHLEPLDQPWGPDQAIVLNDPGQRDTITWKIIGYGESKCDEPGRQAICQTLGAVLAVDYEELVASRILGLVAEEELLTLERMGIDIQLHTHRHRLPPEDEAACRREIQDNREFIQNALGETKTHLCYPSGVWDKGQWPCLEAEGVESATTCEPGLNTASTPRMGLHRVLDQDNLSRIEFEAELFGFCELLRILSGKHRR